MYEGIKIVAVSDIFAIWQEQLGILWKLSDQLWCRYLVTELSSKGYAWTYSPTDICDKLVLFVTQILNYVNQNAVSNWSNKEYACLLTYLAFALNCVLFLKLSLCWIFICHISFFSWPFTIVYKYRLTFVLCLLMQVMYFH